MHRRLSRLFRIFGPAWITMLADMDASSIIGAAQLGSAFQYSFIWFLLLLILPLYIIQEASGRIGAVTRQGLGDTIRSNYSKVTASLMVIPMFFADIATYVAEFLGIGVGLEILGIPLYAGIIAAYAIFLVVAFTREYESAERILVAVSALLVFGLFATLLLRGVKPYPVFAIKPSPQYLFLASATIGAVVMPFMLFFQASATGVKIGKRRRSVDEKVVKEIKENTLIGAIVTELLMVVVEMTFAGVRASPGTFISAQSLASVLQPIAGRFSPYVFGIGLIASGFLALIVVALASAWSVAEVLRIKKRQLLYVAESLPAILLVLLIPPSMLINGVIDFLVVFVFVLLGPAIILGMIAQNRKIMGRFAFSKREAIAYWLASAFVLVFGIASAIISIW